MLTVHAHSVVVLCAGREERERKGGRERGKGEEERDGGGGEEVGERREKREGRLGRREGGGRERKEGGRRKRGKGRRIGGGKGSGMTWRMRGKREDKRGGEKETEGRGHGVNKEVVRKVWRQGSIVGERGKGGGKKEGYNHFMVN